MTKVHIVADSTFRISPEMLAAHDNLHIVSLKLRLGTEEWLETDITTEEMLKMSRERGLHPATSQPSTGEFLQVFEPLLKDGCEIVVLTLAGGLSGTVGGARTAAQMADSKRIQVIDSTTTSVGGIKLTEAALQMAAQGFSAEEIAANLTARSKATKTLIIPGDLTFLQKGGRIGGAAALFGNILQIKPLLYLDDNSKVAVLDKVRTRKRALLRGLEEVKKAGELEYIAVAQIEAETEAAELIAEFKNIYPELTILTDVISPVITAHIGPGTVGFVYQQKMN